LKIVIIRKVIFKGDEKGKADSITNQYSIESDSYEEIAETFSYLWSELDKDFTQIRGK
jgi:hypothetical protein